MRREGRQHATVKTYPTPRNEQPMFKTLSGLPKAGPVTRVTTKPTNHSKFTGRSMWCDGHINPASKGKAAQRPRGSSNAVSDYELTRLSGSSTTNVLDHLDREDDSMDYYEDGEY